MRIGVVVATPVRLFGEGLQLALADSEFDVVGVAASVSDVRALLVSNAPRICLLDPQMADAHAIIRLLHGIDPTPSVVIVGLGETSSDLMTWALEGIDGFVTRTDSVAQLLGVVRGVLKGECLCSPAMTAKLLSSVPRAAGTQRSADAIESLTNREREIVALIADGLSNKQISHQLGISISTVKNHVHRILDKLGVHGRWQAGRAFRSRTQSRRPRQKTRP
ncbi:MAG: response regulator transcription factor [Gemmatimonadetes bacterium]|nr:response regulator transcription factor [Gemmatimonadota bacterium]